ncbi:uncharacterized protein J3D65DRAFT_623556 [Phyllosticta citribraziliensis]|uniref:Secreted protein n=1 Tax=Phyllosticta citribraziliensis TaxID=989973 RepID=A0ABR1LQ65_9PEZI
MLFGRQQHAHSLLSGWALRCFALLCIKSSQNARPPFHYHPFDIRTFLPSRRVASAVKHTAHPARQEAGKLGQAVVCGGRASEALSRVAPSPKYRRTTERADWRATQP